jgi:hypothetical protein
MNNESNTSNGTKIMTPRKVTDNNYSTLMLDLLGFDAPGINQAAATMLNANLTEGEVVSILYVKGIESMRTVLSNAASVKSHTDFDPHQIWQLAHTFKRDVMLEYAKAISIAKDFFGVRVPPRYTIPGNVHTVILRPSAHYQLTSDPRNNGPVDTYISGHRTALNPGETLDIQNATAASLSSITPQLIMFSRVGGDLVSGSLVNTVPMPREIPAALLEEAPVVEQPVAPMQMMSTPPKRSWFSFRK